MSSPFEEILTVLATECIVCGIDRKSLVKAFSGAAKQYESREQDKAIEKEVALLRVGTDIQESLGHGP